MLTNAQAAAIATATLLAVRGGTTRLSDWDNWFGTILDTIESVDRDD